MDPKTSFSNNSESKILRPGGSSKTAAQRMATGARRGRGQPPLRHGWLPCGLGWGGGQPQRVLQGERGRGERSAVLLPRRGLKGGRSRGAGRRRGRWRRTARRCRGRRRPGRRTTPAAPGPHPSAPQLWIRRAWLRRQPPASAAAKVEPAEPRQHRAGRKGLGAVGPQIRPSPGAGWPRRHKAEPGGARRGRRRRPCRARARALARVCRGVRPGRGEGGGGGGEEEGAGAWAFSDAAASGHLGGAEACAGGPQICVAMKRRCFFACCLGWYPKWVMCLG